MAQVPLTGGPYVSPSDVILRYDARTIGELLVDDDRAPRLQPAEILVDATMAAFCLEASGDLEAALVKGHRQNPEDLQAVIDNGGSAAQMVIGLLSGLVMAKCLARRPDRFDTPKSVEKAEAFLEQLSTGERIIPTMEAADAGMKVPPIQLPITNFPLITQTARRYFGPMNRPQLGGLD